MARNYAQIMCAIWEDPEFIALSEVAQRAYFLLITQPDISAAGVLRMWTPRWAALSGTSTDETLKAALSELKSARYIVPDWVTGELLVRSFVKWDGGYKNSKRKPLILREARTVRSAEIKAQLRVEFDKLELDPIGLPDPTPPAASDRPSDRASDGNGDSVSVGIDSSSGSTANGVAKPMRASRGVDERASEVDPADDSYPQVDRASDTTSPSGGVVGTEVSSEVPPQSPNPQPVPPSAAAVAASTPGTSAQTLIGEWLDLCRNRPPKAVIGQTSKAVKALLAEGIDPSDIRAGIASWTSKGLHPAALPSVVNEVMNGSVLPFRPSQRREHQPYKNPPPEAYLEPDAWGTP